jgi:hypothetical protein
MVWQAAHFRHLAAYGKRYHKLWKSHGRDHRNQILPNLAEMPPEPAVIIIFV